MDHIAAKIAARLDAEDRKANMALIRRIAIRLVRDIRQRIDSVERVSRCDFASAPERLAEWAIGHKISVVSHPITGDTQVLVHYPIGGGRFFAEAVLLTYTPAHGQDMGRYLEQRICIEWDRTAPAPAQAAA